ncbi:MAG TPA: hypothetical protein VJJ21_04745 [Candidatus Nanoarchaeia archaeon]|nr:hypothetical protein [Candidatus Nanoarchaeia archaeon]
MSKKGNAIGSWAFLIGVILAVVLGFLGEIQGYVAAALVILGIVVGLLNISDDEVSAFLTAGAVLVIVSYMGASVMDGVPYVGNILTAMSALFVPATIVVALKSVFSLAKG